jgi:hypothetical protein
MTNDNHTRIPGSLSPRVSLFYALKDVDMDDLAPVERL